MSTQAAVRAAWAAGVWANASVTAITPKIYDFDIESLARVSRAHGAKLYHNQKINFFQYTVARSWRFDLTASHTVSEYVVTIRYYRDAQEDFTGTAFNAIASAFETIISTVSSGLGTSWTGTVEYYFPQNEPPQIGVGLIEERPVWTGTFQFKGIKQI